VVEPRSLAPKLKIDNFHFLHIQEVFTMKTCAISIIIGFTAFFKLTSGLQCFTTGIPWPKECSVINHQPACLNAIVFDGWFEYFNNLFIFFTTTLFFSSLEYKNPVEIQECSTRGDLKLEIIDGCGVLRKRQRVKDCHLCFSDNCNHISGTHPRSIDKLVVFTSIGFVAITI
jgi:hypothetical protein